MTNRPAIHERSMPAPSGTRRPKLHADGIQIEYPSPTGGNYVAVSDISLTIEDSSFVCMVGPSGCGKSSFLNAVAGLRPHTQGSLTIDGNPVTGPGPDRSVVFQEASLLPWRTVLRNVAYFLEIHGEKKATRLARARQMIDLVGLSGFEDHYPHQLSGGMKQRANLARALALDPQIMLLDEPFAALDAQTRAGMQGELLRIWEASHKTALFVTHQIEEAVLLGDKVIVLSRGPGSHIAAEIVIDLPRPRPPKVTRSARFLEYTDFVWDLIRSNGSTDEPSISKEVHE